MALMCTGRAAVLAAIVVLVGPALAASQGRGAQIMGHATDTTRSALPGVVVTVTGRDFRSQALSQADGRFAVPDVPPGAYVIRGELPGFEAAIRNVAVTSNGTVDVSLILEVGGLCEVDYVIQPFADVVVEATAIVHARIINVEPAGTLKGRCGNAVTYTGIVIETLKSRAVDQRAQVIRWVEDKPDREHQPGHDYIALVNWDAAHSRYDAGDGSYVFPIEDGRVESSPDHFAEINGATIDDVTNKIRRILRNGR